MEFDNCLAADDISLERAAFDDMLNFLSEKGKAILSCESMPKLVDIVYDALLHIMPCNLMAVGQYNTQSTQMVVWTKVNDAQNALIEEEIMLSKGYWISHCFEQQADVFINDYSPEKYTKSFVSNLSSLSFNLRQSFIYVPLVFNTTCWGFLTVQAYAAEAYSPKHLAMVKHLALFVAIFMDRGMVAGKMLRLKNEVKQNMVKIDLLNQSMEAKVKQRTRQMAQKNYKLASINKELEMLSIVARQTENAIMIMDATGKVLWVNDYFTKMYKYTLEEFIQHRGENILTTSFNPAIEQKVRFCIESKEAVTYEALNVALTGREIWIQTTLTPILDADGNIEHLVTIDTDISKRKLAQRAIVNQKEKIEQQAKGLQAINKKLERLSIVARQTENAIMIMDAEGNILWINEYFTKIYEYTLDYFSIMRGKNILDTSYNPDIVSTLKICKHTKQAISYEALNITKSGKEIWTQTTLTPILNHEGNIEHLVTIDTDITKRKIFEAKIKKQNQNITDSIVYARRIQKAILPNNHLMDMLFNDYFIINKPRDIVSGDFYWAKKIKYNNQELKVLVVADCTGHGVPGAFVSMLGIALLTDIFSNTCTDHQSLNAGDILNELRKRVKLTLNQKGNTSETKDGMDLALCIINEQEQTLCYAGANNPMYHLKFNAQGEREMVVYTPTRNPIGVYCDEQNFESKVFNYAPNDSIYLFTDGLVDQFGGDKGRKFMARNFRSLLLDLADEPMVEKEIHIKESLKAWKNGYDQVDDIMVIGVEL